MESVRAVLTTENMNTPPQKGERLVHFNVYLEEKKSEGGNVYQESHVYQGSSSSNCKSMEEKRGIYYPDGNNSQSSYNRTPLNSPIVPIVNFEKKTPQTTNHKTET
jgi:hypothetical protein